MRILKPLFIGVFLMLNISHQVLAIEAGPTIENEFFQTSPLIISAYQTKDAATSLAAVEVYNDSKTLVNMEDWQLSVSSKSAESRRVSFTTKYSGSLQPGEHISLGEDESLTYHFEDAGTFVIANIELKYTGRSFNYRSVLTPVKEADDNPMFRLYSGTGYSSVAQPFANTPYRTFYDDGLYAALPLDESLRIVEIYPYASICSPFDESVLCGDYVKLQNTGADVIIVDDLVLRTNYYGDERSTSNTFTLVGDIQPGETLIVNTQDKGGNMTLGNGSGYVWLEDKWGLEKYTSSVVVYDEAGIGGQGYAYAVNDKGEWLWTTTPSPMGENVIIAPIVTVAECPDGKYRSPETGRCRTIEEAVNAMTACEEGYERNPTTNRCRKLVSVAAATLTPCLEGQERNPATNRCRSIAHAVAELLPCDEGYERNPATNRCRKIQSSAIPLVNYPVAPSGSTNVDTSGWLAFAAVVALGLGYALWEWRHGLSGLYKRTLGIFKSTK